VLGWPAQATSITRTFTGFNGIFSSGFQPTRSSDAGVANSVRSQVSLLPATMEVRASDLKSNATTTSPYPFAQYDFNVPTYFVDPGLDATNGPSPTDPTFIASGSDYTKWRFTSGVVKYDWQWIVPSGAVAQSRALSQYGVYQFKNDKSTDPYTFSLLNQYNGGPSATQAADPVNYSMIAANVSFNVGTDSTFGFLSKHETGGQCNAASPFGTFCKNNANGGLSTLKVTNFSFVATYQQVPGPLPVAAAGAGFAWSRKLRRRLKTAGLSATA